MVVSPSFSRRSASPSLQSPMFSYQSSSNADERSYTSARSRSSGPIPASAYAASAIESRNDASGSATPHAESVAKLGISITVLGKRGVTVETPVMVTGFDVCRRAKSMLVSTRAAPPSLVAQISSSRRGSATGKGLPKSRIFTFLVMRARMAASTSITEPPQNGVL